MAGLALDRINMRQHCRDCLNSGIDGLARPARFLDGHGAESFILYNAIGFLEARDLEALAAKADHQNPAHIRIGGIAPRGSLQDVEDSTAIIDDAAIGLAECHHAIYFRIILEDS